MAQAYIRPGLFYAWLGPSQLIVNRRGECADDETLAGLYFRETRYLRVLGLTINGKSPWLSQAVVEGPTVLRFDYGHPEMRSFGGGGSGQSGDEVQSDEDGIPYRALDLRLRYEVGLAGVRATLDVTNHSQETVNFEAGWRLAADFADIQEAQGGTREQEAATAREGDGSRLVFRYRHPGLPYETHVAAAGGGEWLATDGGLAARITLASQETAVLALAVEARDYEGPLGPGDATARERARREWERGLTDVRTPGNAVAGEILARNARDVASFPLLEGEEDEWLAPQAGMPIYPALFGRDALTAGWQAAMLDRGAMLDATLTRLGRLQSDRVLDWTDEEPGRIPFQLRRGPLARLGLNPFAAYYADYASPLMFIVALAQLYAWTGDRAALRRHWDVARRILDWAREYGDADGDGYLEYHTKSSAGPKNQGWKDSGRAVLHDDGGTVPSPIATCELQGYWFAARQMMAVLSAAMGALGDAKAHWDESLALKGRFNRDWWVPEERSFALAMDPDKRLIRAVTSNVGHCIASGIVAEEHLAAVVGRLFAPDMFSGWGIRTLSTGHPAYNPVSYHLGSVWAVENATIAFGLRRFGFDTRAVELTRSLLDLAALYPEGRIPECVGGHARGERSAPGVYPRANAPQLWNASGSTLLVQSLLGIQPVAPLDLLVVDPVLPTWLPEVVVHDLRLGGATATLRFWRGGDGVSHAEVLHQRGTLRLVKQPPPESRSAGVYDRLRAFMDGVWHR